LLAQVHSLIDQLTALKTSNVRLLSQLQDANVVEMQHVASNKMDSRSIDDLQTKLEHARDAMAVKDSNITELRQHEHVLTRELQTEEHAYVEASVQTRAENESEQRLSRQLDTASRSLIKQASTIQQLEHSGHQLGFKLNATIQADAQLEGHLRSNLSDAIEQMNVTKAKLMAEQAMNSELQANNSLVRAKVDMLAKAARRDRLGLLNQVSELQEDARETKESGLTVEQEIRTKLDEADRRDSLLQSQFAAHDKEDRRLLEESHHREQEARANASATFSEVASARKEEVALRQAMANREQRLQVSLLEGNELRSTKDKGQHEVAVLRQQRSEAQTALQRAKENALLSQQALQNAQHQAAALAQETETLRHQRGGLSAQLEALKKTTAQQQTHSEAELHSVMLSAAGKVREMEERTESLQDELQNTQQALATLSSEDSDAKETLMHETQAGLKTSQRADDLNASLVVAQNAIAQRDATIANLSSEVAYFDDDRKRTTIALSNLSEKSGQWQAKVQLLQQSGADASSQVRALRGENAALRSQLAELTREGQQLDALSSELVAIRAASKTNHSRESKMAEQMQRLRELKDHYSSEFEAVQRDAGTWQAKAEDLEHQLHASQHSAAAIAQQRDAASERIRSARSEVDEYFEENTRLQQQNDALEARLRDAGQAANRSAAEISGLQREVGQLQGDMVREQQVAHAAWMSSARELEKAKQDVGAARQSQEGTEAQLLRAQSALQDWKHTALGLPLGAQAQQLAHGRLPSQTIKSGTSAPVAAFVARRIVALVAPVAATAGPVRHMPQHRRLVGGHGSAGVPVAVSPSTASTLQKLAEYFASPFQK